MKNGILSGALMLVLTFGAGCGDDDDDGSSGGSGDLCTKLCAALKAVNCPNDDESACKTECNDMLDLPICQEENRALLECTIGRPSSDFECDDSGEADLKDGVCGAELTAMEACYSGGVGGTGGAGGTGGDGTYTCQDGTTIIPEEWVCDGGDPDCPDGDDEQGC